MIPLLQMTRYRSLPRKAGDLARLISLMGLCALTACSPQAEQAKPDTTNANISPYNHTEEYISELFVDENWGGNSRAYGGGGSFVCCYTYPRKWHPGLTATVRWQTTVSGSNIPPEKRNRQWHEKVVPVDQYEKPGTRLNVHFLPNYEVRLIVSQMGSGHPQYPGPTPPVKPADFDRIHYPSVEPAK